MQAGPMAVAVTNTDDSKAMMPREPASSEPTQLVPVKPWYVGRDDDTRLPTLSLQPAQLATSYAAMRSPHDISETSYRDGVQAGLL